MSRFEIIYQDGLYTRKKLSKDKPLTPWLLENSEEGFKMPELVFQHIKLLDKKVLNLTTSEFLSDMPEFSILSPLLKPSDRFEKSEKYELDTFLDRLDMVHLPQNFALVYDDNYGEDYLSQLLHYNPIVIVLQGYLKYPPKQFAQQLIRVRNLVPLNVGLYLAGDIPVGLIDLVFACGVDIIDDSSVYMAAFMHKSFEDGFVRYIRSNRRELVETNLRELHRDFRGAKNSDDIYGRMIRSAHASPNSATFVRYFFQQSGKISGVNLYERRKLRFIGDDALMHPVVQAYQKRMLETYEFPKTAQLLVLLPCSAKKPYSESRSHRFFNKILQKAYGKGRGNVVVWSLTSPLGAVPRELENIFPAANYDIAVSGDWSQKESQLTGHFLKDLLAYVPENVGIVSHLSEGYSDMFEIGIEGREYVSWIGNRPTSHEAGNTLFSNLKKFEVRNDVSVKMIERMRKIRSITRWQFGKEFEIDLSSLKFKGYAPKPIQATKNGKHWFSWDSLRGVVKYSTDALKSSNYKTNKKATVEGDIAKSSTIFRPGLLSINSEISPGDEVLLFNERDEFIGIGTALLSGTSAEKLSYGAVLKIRKKVRRN